jgi:hypothetical protein
LSISRAVGESAENGLHLDLYLRAPLSHLTLAVAMVIGNPCLTRYAHTIYCSAFLLS